VTVPLPQSVRYCIIGAGIHGLSTAYHLATELNARGLGDGSQILVLDKSRVGAGASGIACGVIRNNYYQPAMRELMAHSVSVWESDPKAFAYHPVGYMQISHEGMHDDVAQIYEQQRAIGYESTFVDGVSSTTGGRRESPASCMNTRVDSRSINRRSLASQPRRRPRACKSLDRPRFRSSRSTQEP